MHLYFRAWCPTSPWVLISSQIGRYILSTPHQGIWYDQGKMWPNCYKAKLWWWFFCHMLYVPAMSTNSLRPRQNGWHFADNIFKCISLNENVWIPVKISLRFVPEGPINNIPALVLIMAWRRLGDKPLSEKKMVVRLPMHICITRPQWVN